MKNQKQQNLNKQNSDYIKFSSLGIQMVAIILIFVYAGIKIDKWLLIKYPIFTIGLSILSIFLVIYYAIKEVTKKE